MQFIEFLLYAADGDSPQNKVTQSGTIKMNQEIKTWQYIWINPT